MEKDGELSEWTSISNGWRMKHGGKEENNRDGCLVTVIIESEGATGKPLKALRLPRCFSLLKHVHHEIINIPVLQMAYIFGGRSYRTGTPGAPHPRSMTLLALLPVCLSDTQGPLIFHGIRVQVRIMDSRKPPINDFRGNRIDCAWRSHPQPRTSHKGRLFVPISGRISKVTPLLLLLSLLYRF